MIGLILAGGESLRMGRDKATIRMANGLTMAELAYKKLTSIGLTVYLSVSKKQSKDPDFYGGMPILMDHADIQATGPLRGLLSAHRKFPMDDIFLLACNMPLMEVPILDQLFDLWLERISDIYVYQRGGRAEPLCGIYTYHGLRQMVNLINDKPNNSNSLQYYVQSLNTCYMHIPQDGKLAFLSINTEEQLDLLSEIEVRTN